MNLRIGLCSGVVIGLLFLACGPKVMIPPKVDLKKYGRVGLIGFGSNAEGNMDEFVTRHFLMTIRAYQHDAEVIELGSVDEVLESVQAEQIDSKVVHALGQKYNVNAIFTGNVEITEIQPLDVLYSHRLLPEARPISGKTSIEGKRVKAMVKAWLTVRLWETEQGGTIWRTSTFGEEMVGQVSAVSEGKVVFDAKDPREAFWDLVNPLVKKICVDFKVKYERMQKNHQ